MKALILSLILSLSLSSCEWIKSLGPEEPFFCKINGEKFRPQKDDSPIGGWGSKPLNVEWKKEDSLLAIGVRNNPYFVGFNIKFSSKVIEKGDYQLTSNLTKSIGFFTPDRNSGNVKYNVSSTGVFRITKVENLKIWGTFEFVCQDSISKKEYKITEGEFNNLSYF
ncbi:MAG: hypothetical protein ACI9YE_002855 [Psychroserpens sp.]|jgi:hypothetical protein